jgi:preprotein translocase subunit SecG
MCVRIYRPSCLTITTAILTYIVFSTFSLSVYLLKKSKDAYDDHKEQYYSYRMYYNVYCSISDTKSLYAQVNYSCAMTMITSVILFCCVIIFHIKWSKAKKKIAFQQQQLANWQQMQVLQPVMNGHAVNAE